MRLEYLEEEIPMWATEVAQLEEEKEELRIECNRLYGIGQEYDKENAELRRENEELLLALFSLYQEAHGLGTLIQVELADVLFETRKAIGYDRLSDLLTEQESE